MGKKNFKNDYALYNVRKGIQKDLKSPGGILHFRLYNKLPALIFRKIALN